MATSNIACERPQRTERERETDSGKSRMTKQARGFESFGVILCQELRMTNALVARSPASFRGVRIKGMCIYT